MEKRKTYEAELVLGLKTDTQDMTGEIIENIVIQLNYQIQRYLMPLRVSRVIMPRFHQCIRHLK